MSGLKTLLFTIPLALSLLSQGQTARANIDTPERQLRFFATCAGRLSAQMEYQWMFDGLASEITKQRRAMVLDMIAAIIPPDRGREILSWRIDAKMAHSALLTRAKFNSDADDAAWALQMSDRLTGECAALLLS